MANITLPLQVVPQAQWPDPRYVEAMPSARAPWEAAMAGERSEESQVMPDGEDLVLFPQLLVVTAAPFGPREIVLEL